MQQIPKEWVEFLRQQFPVGSRVRLREMSTGDSSPVAPGSIGTLVSVDDAGTFQTKWDNGWLLGVVIGQDSFSVLPPATQVLKLYMPLTAEIIEYNRYGDLDDELTTQLDAGALVGYEDKIAAALVREQAELAKDTERGIMEFYGEDDSVDKKVRSATYRAETRDGKLWCVAECRVAGELTPDELEKLKEHIGGDAADGLGEGFEQHEIKLDEGQMFVHLWNGDNWSIMTEQERFDPKFKDQLPDLCWSVLPGEGKLICIKRGESGYYPSDSAGPPSRPAALWMCPVMRQSPKARAWRSPMTRGLPCRQ